MEEIVKYLFETNKINLFINFKDNKEALKILIQKFDVFEKYDNSETLLSHLLTADNANSNLISLIMDNNKIKKPQYECLHIDMLVAQNDDVESLKLLYQNKELREYFTSFEVCEYYSSLSIAIDYKSYKCIDYLLENNIFDLNKNDDFLSYVLKEKYYDIVDKLIKHGAKIKEKHLNLKPDLLPHYLIQSVKNRTLTVSFETGNYIIEIFKLIPSFNLEDYKYVFSFNNVVHMLLKAAGHSLISVLLKNKTSQETLEFLFTKFDLYFLYVEISLLSEIDTMKYLDKQMFMIKDKKGKTLADHAYDHCHYELLSYLLA